MLHPVSVSDLSLSPLSGRVIDGRRGPAGAQFANDRLGPVRDGTANNLMWAGARGTELRAARALTIGEELTLPYGLRFWNSSRIK